MVYVYCIACRGAWPAYSEHALEVCRRFALEFQKHQCRALPPQMVMGVID